MKNLRDTLVFMVGRRVAIAASVCALACIRCSSFSGNEPSTPPSEAGAADSAPGSDGGTPPPSPMDAGACESKCKSVNCELAKFDANKPAQIWVPSPDDSRISYVDDELLMTSGANAEAVYLRRPLDDTHSTFHLEFDFRLDTNAIVKLAQFSTAADTFFVNMTEGQIVIGETKNSTQAAPVTRLEKGHMSLVVDKSSISATFDCDPGSTKVVNVASPLDAFKIVSLGLHDGVEQMVELRIDNLIFEAY